VQINLLPNQSIAAGQHFLITNYAQGPNLPIKFCLGPGAPVGAFVKTNGVFSWQPSCEQGSTTNPITVWAIDSSTPPLSNSMTFVITVGDCAEVGIGSTVLQVGQTSAIPVTLFSTVGITNLSFTLASPDNHFTNWTIASSNTSVATATAQTTGSSPPLFALDAQPSQTLLSPSTLGNIAFAALPGDSAFVRLTAINIIATKSDGSGVETIIGLFGRAVVIGSQPLLEGSLGANSTRTLIVYGNPGSNYQIFFNTNLLLTNWQSAGSVLMTNLQQDFNVDGMAPQIYYRAQGVLGN
jgi:hypothetical protein